MSSLERPTGRLNNFSDGVFGVAATVLIVPVIDIIRDAVDGSGQKAATDALKVVTASLKAASDAQQGIADALKATAVEAPAAARNSGDSDALVTLLGALGEPLILWLLSVVVVGTFWIAHHNMLHLVKKWDRWFLWINTGFLMSVTFIPVPLAILANYRVPLAVLIYGFALIVSSVWLLAIWEYMARHPELLWDDVNQGLFKPVRRQILWAPGVYGVATVLAGLMHWFERDGFWVPLIPIALLQSWYMLPGNIDRDAKARTVAPAAVSGE